MIGTLLLSSAAHHTPSLDEQRLGVYVLAGVVGLLVAGLIACSRELAREFRS